MASSICLSSLRAALPSVGVTRVPQTVNRAGSIQAATPSVGARHLRQRAARGVACRSACALPTFSGLQRENALGLTSERSVGWTLTNPGNGSRVFAMRHRKRIHRLGRPADQRKALLRSLTTELLRHGKIKTTRARARALPKYVDKMITLARGNSLHQRRQALAFVYDKQVVAALFAEAPDRYKDRASGFTRVFRTRAREGDNAPMAYIELV